MVARIVALETKFNIYAFYGNAVVKKTGMSGSFTQSAIACRANGSFPGHEGSFTANAVIV